MPRHLALPGHLLIYGVYPELKRLRRTPAVVGWRPSEDASRDATSDGRQPPVARRAYSIAWREAASLPLPLGTDHARAIPRMDFGFSRFSKTPKSRTFGDDRRRSSRKKAPSRFFLKRSARALCFALFVSLTKSVSPRFPSAAQETKRQGERAGHDRIQALELRQGFPRRQRLGRFGTSSGETLILRSEATRAEFVARFFFSLFSRLASRPL